MAGPKPMLTEFSIHHRLESCALFKNQTVKFIYMTAKSDMQGQALQIAIRAIE